MNNGGTWFKVAFAAFAAFFARLDPLVQVLIALMVADIASGLLAAFVNRELSSDVSFRGMAKKAIVLILVAIAAMLGPVVNLPLGQAVAGFYAAHEGLSIIENAARAGLPVPNILQQALAILYPPQEEDGDGQDDRRG